MSRLRWMLALGLAFVTLLSFAACSGEERSPRLSFDKQQVSLDTVALDNWVETTFLAANRGEAPLKLGPLVLTVREGSATVRGPEGEAEVQPGQAALLPIQFRGEVAGAHRLTVEVPSNDPSAPLSTLAIQFTVASAPLGPPEGPGPRLRVDKEIVDAGQVPSDHPLYERFLLRNDGNEPLVLTGAPLVKVLDGC